MYLTREPIEIPVILSPPRSLGDEESHHDGILRSAQDDGANFKSGASVLFLGICRDNSDGRSVSHLEYEAYEEMAERAIGRLIESANQQWAIHEILLLHRLGTVHLGEIAVAIDVRSAHRGEAYAASRFLIENLKHEVPIWKKEFFTDGTSEWSLCKHAELERSAG